MLQDCRFVSCCSSRRTPVVCWVQKNSDTLPNLHHLHHSRCACALGYIRGTWHAVFRTDNVSTQRRKDTLPECQFFQATRALKVFRNVTQFVWKLLIRILKHNDSHVWHTYPIFVYFLWGRGGLYHPSTVFFNLELLQCSLMGQVLRVWSAANAHVVDLLFSGCSYQNCSIKWHLFNFRTTFR